MTSVKVWLEAFARGLAARDTAAILALFSEDCFWRDLLAFTWNIKTLEGQPAIAAMLEATLATTAPQSWAVDQMVSPTEATIRFETATGWCVGRVTLRDGKCLSLFTALRDLKGYEEPIGTLRPKGVVHGANRRRETWAEAGGREAAALGDTVQPYCVIIGGGQGGLALGARLRHLGVPHLILEANPRAGDSWRNRYRSLVLHDPVWYDHMPYLPFPDGWPVFTPKDKMGDWLEMYARVMELPVWTSTTCDHAAYNAMRGEWLVQATRAGKPVTLRPKHLVFATGAYGPPKRLDLPGAESFGGPVMHASQYQSGSDHTGKRCVVIGAASSAHDVCVDLWEAGAEVTMIQRSPTIVVRSQTLMDLGFASYSEAAVAAGITTEIADLAGAAMPFALFPAPQRALYDVIRARDAAFYDSLAASGFALTFGPDDTGLMSQALRTASGYYIDVGASDLIISGEIAVISGDGVAGLMPGAVILDSGRSVPADVVIECTGYSSMHETVAQVVSRQVADAVGPCWGLGSGVRGDPGPWQGELRNMWKPTAQEALWFHGGNLALSRFYSKVLALQIKARMEGIATPVHAPPPALA